MKVLESVRTNFGIISVEEDDEVRSMLVDGDCQGRLCLDSNVPASWYMREMIAYIATRKLANRILVLGGGAYILPNYLTSLGYRNIIVIEQSPAIYRLADQYFKINPDIKTIIGDASEYLGSIGKFDIVILDLFNGFDYCETVNLESIKKLCLAPNGVVLENRLKDGVRITITHG